MQHSTRGFVSLLLFIIILGIIIGYRIKVGKGLREVKAKRTVNIEDLLNNLEEEKADDAVQTAVAQGAAPPTIKSLKITVPECGGCQKNVQLTESLDVAKAPPLSHTTCSESAYMRGGGQKIFSYSLFLNGASNLHDSRRKYFEGVALNAAVIAELFPGWSMRVYHNLTGADAICELACSVPNLDFCDVSANPMVGDLGTEILPTLWRFMPLADAQVSVANFRDLDSLVGSREALAVEAWLTSKHALHVMRDHISHNMPMLAGMWGAKISNKGLRKTWRKALLGMLRSPSSRPPHNLWASGDQFLLERYVWGWGREVAMQHDSYTCQMFTKTSPWPSRRVEGPNNYVGAPFALGSSISLSCPEKCRPRDHKEWIQC